VLSESAHLRGAGLEVVDAALGAQAEAARAPEA
jgi:hypothetical protein